MTSDPVKQIRSLFAKAVIQHEAAKSLNTEEAKTYRKILADHADEARLQERRFLAEYQTRFEIARQRIVNEAGMKDRKLTPRWIGSDRFDSSAIDRQADRYVRAAHDRSLAELDQQRDGALNNLFETSERRQGVREKARTDFTRAAERRSGQERRRGPSR